jgi:formylglycine-generating enzyme required for sulfatase activity
MKTFTNLIIGIAGFLLFTFNLKANDLQILEVTLNNLDTVNHTAHISVRLAWQNYWNEDNTGGNHDAIWLFVKYSVDFDDWKHATLSNNESDFSATAGIVETVSDGKGIFLMASAGDTSVYITSTVDLLWKYGTDYVSDTAENVRVSAFGVEMVYIPEGGFTVGDSDNIYGGGSVYTFIDSTYTNPVLIGDTPAILRQYGSDPNAGDEILEEGIMVSGSGGIDTNGDGEIDNSFYPTGYNGFYIMKYEISQGQYAAFLNHITANQAFYRYREENYGQMRYSITGSYPEFYAEYPEVACNFLSWRDGSAYADWAGLRPMTELEFEKACRGPAAEQSNVYPWGSGEESWPVYGYDYQLEAFGTEYEQISNAIEEAPNLNFTQVMFWNNDTLVEGPLRCGIFAKSAVHKNMMETGATYYGVMDMLGNLTETCITIGTSQGRAFTGLNGDGYLGLHGEANTTGWPLWINNDMYGYGYRGGHFLSWDEAMAISYRVYAAYANNPNELRGFRCVRNRSN